MQSMLNLHCYTVLSQSIVKSNIQSDGYFHLLSIVFALLIGHATSSYLNRCFSLTADGYIKHQRLHVCHQSMHVSHAQHPQLYHGSNGRFVDALRREQLSHPKCSA